ncbi:cytochrome P450 [Aspergillus caelatus]|uniref:Bifunctional cytochrome P450/NADPH--P450 reductase n=1 Tax=Aspergillus caelatus TaxID=61420 RepID=A0A5N7A1E8_9EURO|nr:cytochrome P450 [Aspergillus caelatus]KAE8363632.1 cytochrome P450 [Aspergillus caelatus]
MRQDDNEKQICPIPGPRGLPFLGNILDIDLDNGTMSTLEIAKTYYPIFKFTFAGETSIVINSVALLSEVCDEARFHKHVSFGLELLRSGTHDGLFTAYDHEKNWELAHRLLVPAFGPLRIREMFPQMHDIAQQLCLKWQRYGPRRPLNLVDDFTRATLDTIALCAMGYRFNSFYSEGDFHPFIKSMIGFLKEAETQATLPSFISSLRFRAKKRTQLDIDRMRTVCHEIVNERRQTNLGRKNDLLETMLTSRDSLSGDTLSDESIINNMLTFLVAGHETTSGLLSFAMYYLLTTPDAMARATHEVDDVVGDHELTIEHLSKLKYLNAILRETLRLMPTAPGFSVTPYKPEVIGGKYEVKPGDSLDVFLAAVHRDPAVYGSDVDEFRPERMLDEHFKKLPANSWKPFGNGKRSCIGRAFAWQEALMILALILQNFRFNLVDEDYALKIKESLTIKPDNLWAYATPRPSRNMLHARLSPQTKSAHPEGVVCLKHEAVESQPATILYGSNSGTCEALAHRLATEMSSKGPFVCKVQPLDALEHRRLPRGQPMIILTGSYDGRPPENARQFVNWLHSLEGNDLEGIQYAVFGSGHHDWSTTFYKIPNLIDVIMAEHGGARLAPRGSADTAEDDPFAELESWMETNLWPGLEAAFSFKHPGSSDETGNSTRITIRSPYPLRAVYETAVIDQVRVLTSAGTTKKVHVELALPETVHYHPGDHLAVLPLNPRRSVQRVLSLFQIGSDTILYITSSGTTSLPTDTPISAHDLLSGYVELNQVATPASLRSLATKATDEKTAQHLKALASDQYTTEVREKQLSLLDILERYAVPSIEIQHYIQMLSPLRPRQYTISSSPRMNRTRASLTVSVVERAEIGGPRNCAGVASNYLMSCIPGSILRVSLRHANPDFRLPDESLSHPIIMVAAGSGIAPFRAFVQERSIRQKEGIILAPAFLFFGCRGAHLDDLYREELDGFEEQGVVTLFRAFSRAQNESHGCKYVQDLLWMERVKVKALWEQDAKVFVCGSVRMNEGVKATVSKIVSPTPTEEVARRYVAETFT